MRRPLIACMILANLLPLSSSVATGAEVSTFESFRRAAALGLETLLVHVFGDRELLAGLDTLGARTVLDLDEDGKADALAWREGGNTISALDEDGDLGAVRPGGGPSADADHDSDVYLADLGSDGTLDRVVDYIDNDGDGDADRMDLFELTPGSLGVDGIGVTVFLDLDDDNMMFDITDYGYHANVNMWKSDFDGDGCFIAGVFDDSTNRWISSMENPFCFYDWDGDGHTDEALRLEGRDCTIQSMRWSLDADGDAGPTNPRDFDCSMTAIGRIRCPEAFRDSALLRDGRYMRFVGWRHARDLASWALWNRVLLVWDEDDRNVAPFSEVPDRERWEGVIAESYRGFPQVGGPASGLWNKRYELDDDGSGRAALYFSDIDRRVHLSGAESGELDVEGTEGIHALLATDTDMNGFFDTWSVRGSGADPPKEPSSVHPISESVRSLPPFGPGLRSFWRTELGEETEKRRFQKQLDLLRVGKAIRDPSRSGPRRAFDLACEPRPGQTLLVRLPPDEIAGGEPVVLVTSSLRLPGQIVMSGPASGCWFYLPRDLKPEPGNSRSCVVEIGPERAAVMSEFVRVDPWFQSGIAFEGQDAAFRTYQGRLDFFTKNAPRRFILRTDLGDYHVPQPWGMDPFVVGSGPGLGGAYLLNAQESIPLFGAGSVQSQRVIDGGPIRCEVEVVLRGAGVELVRRWVLASGSEAILEALTATRAPSDSVTVGLAVPELEASGVHSENRGVWSFGRSAVGAPSIGLAGASLDAPDPSIVQLEGALAMGFRIAVGDTTHIGWMAGVDTSETTWSNRAFQEIERSREGSIQCRVTQR